MPTFLQTALKTQLQSFLRENDVEFPAEARVVDLRALVAPILETAGIDPGHYDFQTGRVFFPGNALPAQPAQNGTVSAYTATGDLPPIDKFCLEPASNAATRWESWVESFNYYWNAVDRTGCSGEQKRNRFFHLLGPEVQHLYKGLKEDVNVANPFDRAVTALNRHFLPMKSPRYERHVFGKVVQGTSEPFDSFLSRLRAQAKECQFLCPGCQADISDDRILDRVIQVCNSVELQNCLMKKGMDLTLENAAKEARCMEAIKQQVAGMANCNVTEDVARLSSKPSVSKPAKKLCKFCKEWHVFGKDRCPVLSKLSNSDVEKKKQKAKTKKWPRKKKVRAVEGAESDRAEAPEVSDDDSSDEPAFVSCVNSVGRSSLFTKLDVVGTPCRFLLDTGASLNLLNRKFVPEGTELSAAEPVYLYDKTELPILGKCILRVVNEKTRKRYDVLFSVVETGASLLGLNAILKMRLMYVSPSVVRRVEKMSQQIAWDHLTKKHSKLFGKDLGAIRGVKVHISMQENAEPVFCRARPVPYALKAKVDTALNQAIEDGAITKVESSDWASPTVNVVKSDGSIRICGDFSVSVNRALKMEEHPMPNAEDIFASLHGTKFYTRLDFRRCFEQLVVDESSRKYLTVNTHRGLFHFNRLSYGLASAPAICQRTIEAILANLVNEANASVSDILRLLVFVDDILLAADSLKALYKLTDKVLSLLEKKGIRLRLDKCLFGVQKVKYLGHVISAKGIEMDPDKVQCILSAKSPADKAELRSWLGICHYYGRFVQDLATLCDPLNKLLKHDVSFAWSDDCEKAFTEIKSRLTSAPVLTFYNPKAALVVHCDASPFALGAVLSSCDPETQVEKPVAFAHRVLSPSERNYSQLDKESLAIVFACKKFDKFLYGRKFTVVSDHRPLVRIFGEKSALPSVAAARLSRYAVFLSRYNFSVRYRKGKEHQNADTMSRLIQTSTKLAVEAELKDESDLFFINHLEQLPAVTPEELRSEMKNDNTLSAAFQHTKEGWPENCPDPSLLAYYRRRDELSLAENLLFWGQRVVVPTTLRSRVLDSLHSCHPGINKMKAIARLHCWWPDIDSDIELRVSTCDACQDNRTDPPKAEVLNWPIPSGPWRRIHVDYSPKFMGHALLIVVDAFSKWIEIGITRPDNTSSRRTIKMLKTFFTRYGHPKVCVSDNGTCFTSHEFRSFCKNIGMQQKFTAPNSPSTNGQAERVVGLVKAGLKKILSGKKYDFAEAVEDFLFRYRSTPSSTGFSPAKLFLGRELRGELSLLNETKTEDKMRRCDMTEFKWKTDDRVRFRVYPQGRKSTRWEKGRIVEVRGPRHVVIEGESGGLFVRHSNQLISASVVGRTCVSHS